MFDYKRNSNESVEAYKWRLYQAKNSGLIDVSWEALGKKLDEELRPGEPNVDESVYRKEAAIVTRFYEDVIARGLDENQRIMIDQIKIEQMKLRDERTEVNRQIRFAARMEQQMDYLVDVLKEQGHEWYKQRDVAHPVGVDEKEMLILLSDLHIGSNFDNPFGEYNSEIAKKRLDEYMERIVEHAMINVCHKAHVMLLGDMCSGLIHNSIRITNRENVIDQIKVASTLIGDFLYELTDWFDEVDVISVGGNHTRLESKDDALKDERMDNLLPFIVKARLEHINTIHFIDAVDSTIGIMDICGRAYIGVHGDMDDMNRDTVARLTMMLGAAPYCVCMGHMHHAEYRDICGVKMVMGGSLQGSGDDYTISKRLTGKASQTILICDGDGIVAHIPVELE